MYQEDKKLHLNIQDEQMKERIQKGMEPYTKRDEDYWIMRALDRIEKKKAARREVEKD